MSLTPPSSHGGTAAPPQARIDLQPVVNPDDPAIQTVIVWNQGPLNGETRSGSFDAGGGSVPALIGASGTVVVVGGEGFTVTGIPVSADRFDMAVTLLVTNQDGTEVISVSGTAKTTAGDTSLSFDWTAANATALAGSDLTWDGTSAVTSLLGGIFSVFVSGTCGWD